MTSSSTAREIADYLLEIEAVKFSPNSPYTWASGLKSPVYCDNRLTISYPRIRNRIRDGFREILDSEAIHPDVIVGTATAGIPHAAWLADSLELPMAYVRSTAKEHGTGSQVEGRVDPNDHVVVVEDLISTGRSSTNVVNALRQAGGRVDVLLAIFSYDLEAAHALYKDLEVAVHTLTDFDELFAVASARSTLSDRAIQSIREWRLDPAAWSERHS